MSTQQLMNIDNALRNINRQLQRIASALERLSPAEPAKPTTAPQPVGIPADPGQGDITGSVW